MKGRSEASALALKAACEAGRGVGSIAVHVEGRPSRIRTLVISGASGSHRRSGSRAAANETPYPSPSLKRNIM
jgi:hypothetical protein